MQKRIYARLCSVILVAAACNGGPTETQIDPIGIGPEGGTLKSLDGAATLVIPAGALAQKTAVTIVPAPGADVPFDAAALRAPSYKVSADVDFTFSVPATLTIKYRTENGPLGVPESSYRVHHVSGSKWMAVAGGTVAEGADEVTAAITAPGVYGVRRQEPTTACTDPVYHQFDFWIGEWTIQPDVPSSITGEPSGCAIYEHYTPPGLEAKSISVYDPRDGRWHQTYLVVGDPRVLTMSGGLEGGKMVMYVRVNGSIIQRWTWERIDANTVTQKSERTSDNGETYTPGFFGTYKRR